MQVFYARIKLIMALFALVLMVLTPALARAADLTGWWLDATGRAGIFIAPCGGQLCGHIEWLRTPLDEAGRPKTDIHNHDPAARVRPLCGLAMLGGFVPDGQGGYTGGWIYDPASGNTYKSNMHEAPDGSLHIRGYIGIPLFGRSTVMTRPASAFTPCAGG